MTADGYWYNGRRVDSLQRVSHVVQEIEAIEQVVVVPFVDRAPASVTCPTRLSVV